MAADAKTLLDVFVDACYDWTDLDVIIAGSEAWEVESQAGLQMSSIPAKQCAPFVLYSTLRLAAMCLSQAC